MLRFFLCAFIAAALVGCWGPYQDRCIYQRCGGRKPIVAVLPVLTPNVYDEANLIGWDLSSELSQQIRSRFLQSPSIYLLDNIGTNQLASQLNATDFEILCQKQIEKQGAAEFLVVTQLVKHTQEPCKKNAENEEISANLSIDLRVRVLDIRNQKPKVILQELVHHDHFISRAYLFCDYQKNRWGTEAFERTPLGMAHAHLAREVVARVENYIALAKG
jgi:hypothetical protein